MTNEGLKKLALERGWSEQEAEFLVNGPVNSTVRGMASLGAEQPEYLDIAREQVQSLMERNVNKAGGFIDDILKKLGVR